MSRAAVLATVAAVAAPWALAALPRPTRSRGRPFGLATALARVGRHVGVPSAPSDLGARLAASGLGDRVRVVDAMAVKVGAAAVALCVAIGPATVMPGQLGRLLLVGGPVAAFVAPDLWLRRRIGRRTRRLAAELADGLELLRVVVETGLAPWRALEEVGRRHHGLLGRELRIVTRRAAFGVPRAAALEQLVARCPLEAVGRLVAALGRAERHGSPLGPALADLAADVRAERAREVRERAARAAPKIQLAIALLLVPGVLLLVAAAFEATTTR